MTADAIVIAPHGVSSPLYSLVAELGASGVHVHEVANVAAIDGRWRSCAVILDFCVTSYELEAVSAMIDEVVATVPDAAPIVATVDSNAAFVVMCLRGGAFEVLDLQHDGIDHVRSTIERAHSKQVARHDDRELIARQREVLQEMLRDLIQTERRSIDLEYDLAKANGTLAELPPAPAQRQPSVLVIDPDRGLLEPLAAKLEAFGIATVTYASGEDALREVPMLMRWGTELDLAIVASEQKGIDGFETLRRIREALPGIPAVVLGSRPDDSRADRVAALSIISVIARATEPGAIAKQVGQLARDALHKTREQIYLERIKARHERVLARIRALRS